MLLAGVLVMLIPPLTWMPLSYQHLSQLLCVKWNHYRLKNPVFRVLPSGDFGTLIYGLINLHWFMDFIKIDKTILQWVFLQDQSIRKNQYIMGDRENKCTRNKWNFPIHENKFTQILSKFTCAKINPRENYLTKSNFLKLIQ